MGGTMSYMVSWNNSKLLQKRVKSSLNTAWDDVQEKFTVFSNIYFLICFLARSSSERLYESWVQSLFSRYWHW